MEECEILKNMILNLDGTSGLLNLDGVFIYPNIPSKKLTNAIKSYAGDIMPDDVMVLLDDTLFGSASEGLIATKDKLYFKEIFEKSNFVKLDNIKSINVDGVVYANLIINGMRMIKFTQINIESLSRFVNFIETYLENKKNIN